MKIGKFLSKKFLLPVICVLFSAILSLCGANLVNANLQTSSSIGEVENSENDMKGEASGYWSKNAEKPKSQNGSSWNEGTESNPFMITNASELAYIIEDSDAYYLMNTDEIDMSAHYWDWYTDSLFSFSGTIKAVNRDIVKIKNVILGAEGFLGIFFKVDYFLPNISNATISDIYIDIQDFGGFIGTARNSVIDNCVTVGEPIDMTSCGGIVSKIYDDCTITNCVNYRTFRNTSSGQTTTSGGIVGGVYGGGTAVIENCVNFGDIEISGSSSLFVDTYLEAGGIVGTVCNDTTGIRIINCVNYGKISANNGKAQCVGGIIGKLYNENHSYITDSIEIKNCANFGLISASSSGFNLLAGGYIGGIVGYADTEEIIKIENCVNYGSLEGNDIFSRYNLGGILGYGYVSYGYNMSTLTECINYGKIGRGNTGGIAGRVDFYSISGCINAQFMIEGYSLLSDMSNSSISGCMGVVRNQSFHLIPTHYYGSNLVTIMDYKSVSDLGSVAYHDTVISYMEKYGFDFSIWSKDRVYNTWVDNYCSEMVTLNFLTLSANIGIQNEVQIGKDSFEYQLKYVEDGYTAEFISYDLYLDEGKITTDGINSYKFLNNYGKEVPLFLILGNKTKKYGLEGVYDGTDGNATQLSDKDTTTFVTTDFAGKTYIIRSSIIRCDVTIETAYISDLAYKHEGKTSNMVYGTGGGNISSVEVSGEDVDISNNSSVNFIVSYNATVEIGLSLEKGYELFALVEKDSLSDNKIDNETKKCDILGKTEATENIYISRDTNHFNIDFSKINNADTIKSSKSYVLVFSKYQHELSIDVETATVNGAQETSNDKSAKYYFGYKAPEYGRDTSIKPQLYDQNGGKVDNMTTVYYEVLNDFGKNPYSWYVGTFDCITSASDGSYSHQIEWGGPSGKINIPVNKGNEIFVYDSNAFSTSDGTSLNLYVSAAVGVDDEKLLTMSADVSITIKLKKFVVDIENCYGGKFVTYSYYFLDLYDSSTKSENNYVFGSDGGTTSLTENGISEDAFEVTYKNVYVKVSADGNNLTITNANEGDPGAISCVRVDYKLFLFREVDFDETDPLNSTWSDSYIRKEGNGSEESDTTLGGDLKLTDISSSITKTSQKGYYYNENENSFVVAVESGNNFKVLGEEFQHVDYSSSYQVDYINDDLMKDLSKYDLYTIAEGSSDDRKVLLLSYYSLKLFNLTITDSLKTLEIKVNDEKIETGGNEKISIDVKSYSKIDLAVGQTVNVEYNMSDVEISFKKYDCLKIGGETVTIFPNYTFQLIETSDTNDARFDLAIEVVMRADGNNYQTTLLQKENGYYLIQSAQDLLRVYYQLNLGSQDGLKDYKFKQTCDIDLSKYKDLIPLGTKNIPFQGYYDGQNYSIKNFTIDASNLSNVGFFGYVKNATIKNINFVGGTVSGFENVGAVVGYAENSQITNCHNYKCNVYYSQSKSESYIYSTTELDNSETTPSETNNTETKETTQIYDVPSAATKHLNEKMLLRYDESKNEFNIGGEGNVAISMTMNPSNIGGFCGYLAGGKISVASAKGGVITIKEESENDKTEGKETSEESQEDAPNYLGGFVGFFGSGEIQYSYTSHNKFAGNDIALNEHCHTEMTEITCDTCKEHFIWQ